MSKRFCDTEIWNKEWFLKLPLLQRSLFLYIKDNCDCAGIYEPNYMMLSFIMGQTVTADDILKINETKKQIELINGKFFITDFCKFQYGELKPSCKPHIKVIETLKKHGLFERVSKGYLKGIDTLTEGYAKGMDTLEEKEEDKEKEKEKEEDKEKDKEEEKEKKDLFVSTEIEKTFALYQKKCPNLCKLSFERRNMDLRRKIEDFLFEIRGDMTYFEELCKKANNVKYIANSRIDFKSLINNHIGIMNGKYEKPPDETEEAIQSYMEKLK